MKIILITVALALAGCAYHREPIAIAGQTASDFWRTQEAQSGGDGGN